MKYFIVKHDTLNTRTRGQFTYALAACKNNLMVDVFNSDLPAVPFTPETAFPVPQPIAEFIIEAEMSGHCEILELYAEYCTNPNNGFLQCMTRLA